MSRTIPTIVVALALILGSVSDLSAEMGSDTILGHTLYRNSTETFGMDGIRYIDGVTWMSPRSDYGYMSAHSRGFNNHIVGWHKVGDSFKYCSNCSATLNTHAQRCQSDSCGPTGGVTNYGATRHYYETGYIGPAQTRYTSYNGPYSSAACFNTPGC